MCQNTSRSTFRVYKAIVCRTGPRAAFPAFLVLNYWLIEFPQSAVANRFELRCQSKATDATVLQNLSLLKDLFHPAFLVRVVSWLAFVCRHFRGP